jgi:hypothetical protein
MNFRIKKYAGALAVAALLGFGANARATTVYIAPNGSTTPVGTTSAVFGAKQASFHDVAFQVGSSEHGTFSEAVFTDTTTKQLDFVYQFTLNSASDANEISLNDFSGWNTGVGLLTSNAGLTALFDKVGANFGTKAGAITGSRGISPGSTVNFTFTNDIAGASTPSYIFVVQTDATKFDDFGSIFTLDGGVGISKLPVYEPLGAGPDFVSTPLPSTASTGLACLGGLFGFMVIRRRIVGKPVSA